MSPARHNRMMGDLKHYARLRIERGPRKLIADYPASYLRRRWGLAKHEFRRIVERMVEEMEG